MNKNLWLIVAAILILVGVGVILGTGMKKTDDVVATPTVSPTESPVASPTVAGSSEKVTISGLAFAPTSLTIKKGTTVTWTNQDSMSHTVTGTNGGPNSDLLGSGASYSYTFTSAGTFPYKCTVHSSMTGTIIVTE